MRRLALGFLFLVACGGKTDLDGDAGPADAAAPDAIVIKKDASVVDAPYQPLGTKCDPPDGAAPIPWAPDDAGAALRPPIMQSSGGPVLTNPVFVTLTFAGDDLADQLEDFVSSVGCTSYWKTAVSDYGVNTAYQGATAHLTDKPPTTIDDGQIAVFLRQHILNKQIPDAVQGQTLYVIYYPDSTDITLQGSHSCQSFEGYHNEVSLGDGRTVPYAVLPRCNLGGFGLIDELTSFTSHELVEAVTDPFPETNPAYQLPEPNGIAWALSGGGEVGDLCEANDDAFYMPSDYAFTVQRMWTSHAAFLAHDPCQPSDTTYVAAAPLLTDTISYDIGFGTQQTQGVKLALNDTTHISLKIIADGTAGTTTVSVHDASHQFGGSTALTFSLSPQQGLPGDTLDLTINRVGTTPQIGVEPFVIRATSGQTQRSWWAIVGDP